MARKATEPRIVFARSTASYTTVHGVAVRLNVGEPWDAEDPTVKENPQAFSAYPIVRTQFGWKALD